MSHATFCYVFQLSTVKYEEKLSYNEQNIAQFLVPSDKSKLSRL